MVVLLFSNFKFIFWHILFTKRWTFIYDWFIISCIHLMCTWLNCRKSVKNDHHDLKSKNCNAHGSNFNVTFNMFFKINIYTGNT